MGPLSQQQLDGYSKDGYVLLDPIFSPAELDEMRAEADRLIELTIDASLALDELSPRLDMQRRDGKLIVRKIQPVNDFSELFTKVSADERIVSPLRQLLDSEPVLMEEKLNYKQIIPDPGKIEAADEGESFPYHTDLAYFGLDGYPRESLSSALFIDDATPENGPLRVLPGSQHREWPIQEQWPPLVEQGVVPEEEVIDVLGPAGSLLIFHSALVHSSSENRTDKPRRLMIYSHYPSWHEIEFDRRNKPLRERGQAHESRYNEMVTAGSYSPSFKLG